MTSSKGFSYKQGLGSEETAESVKYMLNSMIDALQSNADEEDYLLDWPNLSIETDVEFYDNSSFFADSGYQINNFTLRVKGVKPSEVAENEPEYLVHTHGPAEGRGLNCGERMVNGRLRGWCQP